MRYFVREQFQPRCVIVQEDFRGARRSSAALAGRTSKPTILKGIRELHSRRALGGDGSRIRRRGGGRKPIEEHDPEVTHLLEQIMEESTVGDPMSPLKWSSKSSYQIHFRPLAEFIGERGELITGRNS